MHTNELNLTRNVKREKNSFLTRTLWEILTHRTRPDILNYPKTSDTDAITVKGRRTLYEDINYVFILYFES